MSETLPPAVVHHGDVTNILPALPDASVDAIVTDPPYELGFMGKKWDAAGIAYSVAMWAECLRVLKPGGHLVAFGGTRTYHRMTVAIEDAGFEIRDSLMWLYGSGFPKSHNVGKAIDKAAGATREVVGTRDTFTGSDKAANTFMASDRLMPITAPATPEAAQWDGWGTALKPAFEPIVLARKPLTGTVAANVLAYGTGGLNVDGCRIGTGEESQGARDPGEPSATRTYADSGAVNLAARPGPRGGSPAGRWPANVTLDPEAAAMLDQQSGDRPGFATQRDYTPRDGTDGTTTYGKGVGKLEPGTRVGFNDTGGASRFYYVAKAGKKERPVVTLPCDVHGINRCTICVDPPRTIAHPTVKPLTLMRWLCRLITPSGGLILDPFAGSGTTLEAALNEGFRVVGIEREADYLPLITARLNRVNAAAAARGDDGGLW